jgi:translation initiation factor 2 subunit 3
MNKTLRLSEIIQKQAVLNVGCVGHVSNGKSTLVKQMTGIKTQKFKSERERNCTINVGYGNCKIFYSEDTGEYKFTGSGTTGETDSKDGPMKLIHHISFVDCPGHENYMSNMLCGASVIDMAFLVEAANAPQIPQPQTLEHFIAVQQSEIDDIVVIQNKCDLVKKRELLLNKDKIEDFVEEHTDTPLPIIPLIAQTGGNIDYVGRYLANKLINYTKDLNLPLRINIIRTFDINKPNTSLDKFKGGILGGSISQGILHTGDIIQISPGVCSLKEDGSWKVSPLFTRVVSINSEKNSADYAIPGGLIGVGTLIDPAYTKSNSLTGQIITKPGEHLSVSSEIVIKYKSFRRVSKISKSLAINEILKLGILCKHVTAKVTKWDKKNKQISLSLSIPCCINDDSISIMKKIDKTYKIFSIGHIVSKNIIEVDIPADYIVQDNNTYTIVNDICKTAELDCFDYDTMLNALDNKFIETKRLKIPNPIITRLKNGAKQVVNNYKALLESIYNENDEVSIDVLLEKSLSDELSCPVNAIDKNRLIIHGKVHAAAINNGISKHICRLRKCRVCKGSRSFLSKDGRHLMLNCQDCKATNVVTL